MAAGGARVVRAASYRRGGREGGSTGAEPARGGGRSRGGGRRRGGGERRHRRHRRRHRQRYRQRRRRRQTPPPGSSQPVARGHAEPGAGKSRRRRHTGCRRESLEIGTGTSGRGGYRHRGRGQGELRDRQPVGNRHRQQVEPRYRLLSRHREHLGVPGSRPRPGPADDGAGPGLPEKPLAVAAGAPGGARCPAAPPAPLAPAPHPDPHPPPRLLRH